MAVKYLFTTRELLHLINKSAAMQSLDEQKRMLMIREVQDPDSEKAQRLYSTLIEESQNYKKIDKEYIRVTSQIVGNFSSEVVAMKHSYLAEQISNAEDKARKNEDNAAENILKSIQ